MITYEELTDFEKAAINHVIPQFSTITDFVPFEQELRNYIFHQLGIFESRNQERIIVQRITEFFVENNFVYPAVGGSQFNRLPNGDMLRQAGSIEQYHLNQIVKSSGMHKDNLVVLKILSAELPVGASYRVDTQELANRVNKTFYETDAILKELEASGCLKYDRNLGTTCSIVLYIKGKRIAEGDTEIYAHTPIIENHYHAPINNETVSIQGDGNVYKQELNQSDFKTDFNQSSTTIPPAQNEATQRKKVSDNIVKIITAALGSTLIYAIAKVLYHRYFK